MTAWSSAWLAGSAALDALSASAASREHIEHLRAERLARLLAHARTRSPAWRSLLGHAGATPPLCELPVMTKRSLMDDFDRWVTDPAVTIGSVREFIADRDLAGQAYLGRYQVWESSGSTGEPGIFVQDENALAVYDALEMVRRPVLDAARRGLDPWYACERTAFVGATGGHFASNTTVLRLCRLYPWLAPSLRSFSFLDPLPSLVRALNEFAPTVLMSYPSAAAMLAQEHRAGRLSIPLREVWTGGESLSARMRAFIASAFACRVAQSYGASEFLSLASECRCGKLHLNSDWAILESVDAHGRPVPDGKTGDTVLLTNLANLVQPLIRYELGDRVRIASQACDCGSPFPVIEVEGRVDDSLTMKDKHGHAVLLGALALTTVLEEDAQVFDFQLRQVNDRALELLLADPGSQGAAELDKALSALSRYLHAQRMPDVALTGRCVPALVRGRSGKVPRVVASSHGR